MTKRGVARHPWEVDVRGNEDTTNLGRRAQPISQRWDQAWRRCGPDRLVWGLIGLGIFLRLAQYAANRSLWYDEALLASNIVNRSLAGLFKPLDYFQGAPLGFLVLEKLAVQALGSSEYALRLVPLIAGILSLFLFRWVARQTLRPESVPIAVGLFALLGPLIYYSSEVKQYSGDVAIALFILASARPLFDGRVPSAWQMFVLTAFGAISLWFSHPAVFLLMGVGTAALVRCWTDRNGARTGRLAIVASVWVLSVALLYYVSVQLHLLSIVQSAYWRSQGAFPPLPPSVATLHWLAATFFQVLEYPVGLATLSDIGALTCLVGVVSLWAGQRVTLIALVSPLAFALAASAFHLYLFTQRFLLFAVPLLVLMIAEGTRYMIAASWSRAPWLGILLAGALFFYPAWAAAGHVVKPRLVEELKPVMAYLRAHEQPGDIVYVQNAASWPFEYYAGHYGFATGSYIEGISAFEHWKEYLDELNRFHGTRRLWIVLSHAQDGEGEFLLHYFDARGTKRDAFERVGSAVYLYDLSR